MSASLEHEIELSGPAATRSRSAHIVAPGAARIDSVPVPVPGAREVRVRMEGSGVCASSVPVWEGREWFTYPMEPGAPGHEGWGVIDAIGEEVRDFAVGDHVAALSYHAFAEHDLAADDAIVRLPPELSAPSSRASRWDAP